MTDQFPLGIQKAAALAGVGFALLLLVSIVLGGTSTPDFDAPAQEWNAYAEDNESKIRLGALIFGLAMIEFAMFLGILRSAFGEAERSAHGFERFTPILLIGGIVGITALGLGVFISAAAVAHADGPGEVIRAASLIATSGFAVAAPGFAVMGICAFLLNGRLRVLPSWLSIMALVFGLSFALQLLTLLSDEYDNVFGIFYPLGFLTLFVFSVGASLALFTKLSRAARGAPPAV